MNRVADKCRSNSNLPELVDLFLSRPLNYMLSRWTDFSRFVKDGRICLTNNAAERALRGVACGRKSWLFAGSDEPTSQYCST